MYEIKLSISRQSARLYVYKFMQFDVNEAFTTYYTYYDISYNYTSLQLIDQLKWGVIIRYVSV